MSNLIRKQVLRKDLKGNDEKVPNRRYSIYVAENFKYASNKDSNSKRYNEGSVYRQAFRFNPFISTSNVSSSASGSTELIVSDLEGKIDSQSQLDLSTLKEVKCSEEPETVFLQSLIFQKKHLKENENKDEDLKNIIKQLQNLQNCEKINRERHLRDLRLQVLRSFSYFK